MQGGVNKKKEDKKKDVPLRNVLGSYDPMTVSLPIDQSLSMIGAGQPINLSTMLTPQTPVIKKDKLAQINLGKANTVADIKPKKTDEKVVKYLESKGKIKPKEEVPLPEDPSWFERNKKGLRDAGIILAGGLQSLGEGIKGGNQSAANEQIYENLDAAAKSDEMELLDDPNSEQSKQAQALFSQLYGNRVKMPENLTAAQFSKQSPVFDKILQRKLMEMRSSAPEKPKKRSVEETKIVNSAGMALSAIDQMEKALSSGQNTFSMIGDNDFTTNKRLWSEGMGRMQSGGAINKDEEERFEKMAPSVTDSAETQKKKLQMMRREMEARLVDLDIDPGEAIQRRKIGVSKPSNAKNIVNFNGRKYYVDAQGNNLGEVL